MGLFHTIMPVNSTVSVASMVSLSTTFFLQAISLGAISLCSFTRACWIAAMFCLRKLERMTQGLIQGIYRNCDTCKIFCVTIPPYSGQN